MGKQERRVNRGAYDAEENRIVEMASRQGESGMLSYVLWGWLTDVRQRCEQRDMTLAQ
jgi:hypothetical protein